MMEPMEPGVGSDPEALDSPTDPSTDSLADMPADEGPRLNMLPYDPDKQRSALAALYAEAGSAGAEDAEGQVVDLVTLASNNLDNPDAVNGELLATGHDVQEVLAGNENPKFANQNLPNPELSNPEEGDDQADDYGLAA